APGFETRWTMSVWSWSRAIGAAVGLLGLAACVPAATAQEGWSSLPVALQGTAKTGRPTVVVTTSRTSPASVALRQGLPRAAAPAGVRVAVTLAELSAEANAAQVELLGVKRHPSVIVYRRGKSALEVAGYRDDLTDPAATLAWVGTLLPKGGTDRNV